MPMRDFLFRVHGDCIRAGYAYPLFAAVKTNDLDLATDPRVFLGPFEGVHHFGRGYLAIRDGTSWRIRAPTELTQTIVDLCGRKLIVGDHVIRLGDLRVEAITASTDLYAELVTIKSMHFQKHERHPTHREFLGWVTDKLRRDHDLKSAKVEVGRYRKIQIGKYPAATGYAMGVYGIERPDISIQIEHKGI